MISFTNKSSVINILINDNKLDCIILWKLGQRLTVKPCSLPNSNFAQANDNRSTTIYNHKGPYMDYQISPLLHLLLECNWLIAKRVTFATLVKLFVLA